MKRRQHTQERTFVESPVKRINSLVKLPRLTERQISLNISSPDHNKRSILSPSKSNRTNQWKQKLLIANKLVPFECHDHQLDNKSKNKPKSSLINKLIPGTVKDCQIQERVLSSKLFGTSSKLVGIKNSLSIRNTEIYRIATENQVKSVDNNLNDGKIIKVKQNFKLLLTQEAYNELIIPNFSQTIVQGFYPFWQMVDTIIFTYQRIIHKPTIIKEIVTSYGNLSNQLHQIRKLICSDIQKLNKQEMNEIIIRAFVIELQFVYLILGQLMWKEVTAVFEMFLRNKIQLIVKVRKEILKIYLSDSTSKQQIKVNKRIVGFILLKQKYTNQLQKHIEVFNTDFNALSSQFTDPKFAVFQCSSILKLQDIILFERKLKNKILEVPISPYLKLGSSQAQKYTLIIEPEGFLFKQDKQTSTFLLREGSLNFIKTMHQHCNLIFFSRLPGKTLNQCITYLEQKLNLKFDTVLNKKYMTYKNLKLYKNLDSLGLDSINSRTIVIDPYYKQYIGQEFWKICFPIDKEDTRWEDTSFIDKLTEKLTKKLCSNQITELYNRDA